MSFSPPSPTAEIPVLALNSGSSSLKFGFFRVGSEHVEELLADELTGPGDDAAMARIVAALDAHGLPRPQIIGHRIVHGGPCLRQHILIDDEVERELAKAVKFAPLHMPPALAVLRSAGAHFAGVPHAACFDTAFHAGMPDIARLLPLSQRWQPEGVQRYGFHGLSCASILQQLQPQGLPERIVVAHLGNGASVTAIRGGLSVDHSMGLTPSGGLIMGTRCGDIDPGVLLYLAREHGLNLDALEDEVDRRAGLLGVSGLSSDMRKLHEAAPANADARLAIGMFCRSVAKQIVAMATSLGGLDALVFTGGIGEHDGTVRRDIGADLAWAGVRIDDAMNEAGSATISAVSSVCAVHVLASRENEQIARHAGALLRSR